MATLLYVFSGVTVLLIDIILLLMMIRAIFSWVNISDDNSIIRFINTVTDMILIPMRLILVRYEWAHNFPIDLSFLATYIILFILRMIFGAR